MAIAIFRHLLIFWLEGVAISIVATPSFSSRLVSLHEEGVRDDGDRAEGHGAGRYHGIEEEACAYEKGSCGYGYACGVVNEGPEQVLLYLLYGVAAQLYGSRDVPHVVLYEHYIDSFYGYVSPRAYGYPYVCLGKRGGVVYPVAHHRAHLALLLEIPYLGLLFPGKDLCDYVVYAQAFCHSLSSPPVVPCKHHDFLAHLLQPLYGLFCVLLRRVRDRNYPCYSPVDRDYHCSLALAL